MYAPLCQQVTYQIVYLCLLSLGPQGGANWSSGFSLELRLAHHCGYT